MESRKYEVVGSDFLPPTNAIEAYDYASAHGIRVYEACMCLEDAGWTFWGENPTNGGLYYTPPKERLCNCGSIYPATQCPYNTGYCG